MTGPDALLAIAQAWSRVKVRWLVVGGYAVIAHGYVRLTHDLDIIVDLEPANCRKAMEELAVLGFKPRMPVPMAAFADPDQRRLWQTEREMIVFTVWRDGPGGFEQVDLFLREPFPFAEAWQQRYQAQLGDGLEIPCLDLGRLITMKEEAGRPKDFDDIQHLRRLQNP